MQLKGRIKKLQTISNANFDEWLKNASDEELKAYTDNLSATAPKHSRALREFIRRLSDYELDAIRHDKFWLLSDETKRRLKNVNQITN